MYMHHAVQVFKKLKFLVISAVFAIFAIFDRFFDNSIKNFGENRIFFKNGYKMAKNVKKSILCKKKVGKVNFRSKIGLKMTKNGLNFG